MIMQRQAMLAIRDTDTINPCPTLNFATKSVAQTMVLCRIKFLPVTHFLVNTIECQLLSQFTNLILFTLNGL